MKLIKRYFLLLLALVIFYLGILATIQVILIRNVNRMEDLLKDSLKVQSVHISTFFNMPFLFASAQNVEIQVDEFTVLTIDRIRIRYSLIKALFKGQESLVTLIKLGNLELDGTLGSVMNLINQPVAVDNTNDIKWINKINTRISLVNLKSHLRIVGEIAAEMQISDLSLKWNRNEVWLDSDLYINLNKTNKISYTKAGMDIHIHIKDLKKRIGNGLVKFGGVNLAGVNILHLAPLSFHFDETFHLDLASSPLAAILKQSNQTIYMNIEQNFSLKYEPFSEFYLLEHMFSPGNYQGKLSMLISPEIFKMEAKVLSTNDIKKRLEIRTFTQNDRFIIQGRAESVKYGMGDINLVFSPGNDFPSGTVESRNLDVIPGLGITAKIDLESQGKVLQVKAREVYLNGGRIGTVGSILTLEQDGGISFTPLPGYRNAPVSGKIGKNDYELNIDMIDVPGSALVHNIGFDIFNLGNGIYQGKMRIFNEGLIFRISGQLQGNYLGKRLVKVGMELDDEHMRLNEVYFPQSGLKTSLDLDFLHPAKDRTLIEIKGKAELAGRFYFPVSGNVIALNKKKAATVTLDFDKQIHLMIRSLNADSWISIQASDYPLATFGLPGILDTDVQLSLKNAMLENAGVKLAYSYLGRHYALRLQTEQKQGNILNLKQFVMEMDKEKVYGSGKLWETKNRLNARVDFLRGGTLKFESSFEKINGLFNLKNIYIQDFFQKKQDVYLSLNMNFYGDLIFPDFTISQLTILNSINATPFSLKMSDVRRVPGVLTISSVVLRNADINARLSSRIQFQSSGVNIEAAGQAILGEILQSDVKFDMKNSGKNTLLNYQLTGLSLGKESLGDLNGVLDIQGNHFDFYPVQGFAGIKGSFINQENANWDLELNVPRLKFKSNGSIRNEKISGDLKLKTDLKLLSFMQDVFKNIGGNLSADLELHGSIKDPKVAGTLKVDSTDLSIVNLNMDIKGFKGQIPVQNSKLLFKDFKVPTSTGTFLFDGYVELSLLQVSYIDLMLKPNTGTEAWLNLGMQTPSIKMLGNLFVKLIHIYGRPYHLNLEGESLARNANIFVGLQTEEPGNEEGIIEGIQWNLKVNMGNAVKFGNQFIDTTLSAGQSLTVLGSIGDGSLSLKGDVDVTRGTITFLEQDFQIKEGTASFNGQPGDPLPYINVQTELMTRDQTGERIRVYLTFEGKLSKISLKDFYSVPDRNRNELFALLGFQPFAVETGNTNQTTAAVRNVTMGGWNALENTFIFNPLANTIRRTLGLDLVSIRSQALGNIFENTFFGSTTNIDATSIIEGTSLTFGKYLFSNLFVEYELSFQKNDLSALGLAPMHSFGIGLDWQNFFLGWKYGPQDLGSGFKYEHSLDLQFHRKF